MSFFGIKISYSWDDFVDDFENAVQHLEDAIGINRQDINDFFQETIWEDGLEPLVVQTLALLGIKDTTLLAVNYSSSALLEELESRDLIVKAAIRFMKEDPRYARLITYIMKEALVPATKPHLFYELGSRMYSDGLPDCTVYKRELDIEAIKGYIQEDISTFDTINILEAKYIFPSPEEHLGYHFNTKDGYYFYDNSTGKVHIQTGYFDESEYHIYDIVDFSYDPITYKVTVNLNRPTTFGGDNRTLVTDPIDNVPCYIIKYTVGSGTEENYWYYKKGDEVTSITSNFLGSLVTGDQRSLYEELNTSDEGKTNLEMLPVVRLRDGFAYATDDSTSDWYRETNIMINALGLDMVDLIDSIKSNPDIADIPHAFVHFGIPVHKVDDPYVSGLLFIFFNMIYNVPSFVATDNISYYMTIKEGNYNQAVAWTTLERTTYTSSTMEESTYSHTITTLADNKSIIDVYWQEDLTTQHKITIYNLSNMVNIQRGSLLDSIIVYPEDTNFLLPVTDKLIRELRPIDRIELFTRTLHLTCYSADVIKVKYYESAAFYSVLKIAAYVVAAVLALPSGGTSFMITMATMTALEQATEILLSSSDDPITRAFIRAAVVVASVSTGNVSAAALGLTTVDMLSSAVTEYYAASTQLTFKEMEEFAEEFDVKMEKLLDQYDDVFDSDGIDSDFIITVNSISTSSDALAYQFSDLNKLQYQYNAVYDVYTDPYKTFTDTFDVTTIETDIL